MIFEKLEIEFKPNVKRTLSIIILCSLILSAVALTGGTAYEFEDKAINKGIVNRTYWGNKTLTEPYVLNDLFSIYSPSGVSWNITVSDNVSVYFRNDLWWNYGLTYNGTGGFYSQDNTTYIVVKTLLNGSSGWAYYEYTYNSTSWDVQRVATFKLWRYAGNLCYVALGALLAIAAYSAIFRDRKKEIL